MPAHLSPPARPPPNGGKLAAVRRPPAPTTALATLLLALACARAFPPSEVSALRQDVAACPLPLTDAALDALETYASCTLPASVASLVRNDYADDELELPDPDVLARHAGEIPRSAFEAQLARFVDPAGALAGTVSVDAARGVLWPDPVLAPALAIPFAPEPEPEEAACAPGRCQGQLLPPPKPDRPYREARRTELLAAAEPGRPLAGLRIAIDPGHAGGPYGALEERRVTERGPDGRAVVLQEGDFTLRTALELREKLAADGAQVFLSRDRASLVHPYPLHAFRPYAERLLRRLDLDPAYQRLLPLLAPSERLRLRAALALFAVKKQNRFESLRARARAARAAQADLLLSVHYNGAPGPGGARAREEVLAMVRGAFDEGRLYNPFYRWQALEAAFAIDTFDASAHLGRLCVRAMSERLGLPVAGEPRYADHLPIRDLAGRPTGVDAWDGALLRYLDFPAVLTEGPYLDHPDELAALEANQKAPLMTPGTRSERYAEALHECVLGFARAWLGSERNPFGPWRGPPRTEDPTSRPGGSG